METWIVTPEAAAVLLKCTPHKRTIRLSHVEKLVRQRAKGCWKQTGETIRVATDGFILNGHHRLMMVEESGLATEMDLVLRVDPDTKIVQDTGSTVRASDWTDRVHAKEGTAICNALSRFLSPKKGNNRTREEVSAIWDAFGDEAIQASIGTQRSRVSANAATRMAIGLVHRLNPPRALVMLDRLSGLCAPKGSPEQLLISAYDRGAFLKKDKAAALAARAAIAALRGEESMTKLYEASPAQVIEAAHLHAVAAIVEGATS